MGDILLPTAFTKAITIILVGQDNAYPTTVLEPFSAIIRTSRLVLKAFSGQIKIPNAQRFGFKSKISDYFSKIMKIFSYFFRVCHPCPCYAQLFSYANWERRVSLDKACKPVFPWDFMIELPGLHFYGRGYRPSAAIIASICPFPVLMSL